MNKHTDPSLSQSSIRKKMNFKTDMPILVLLGLAALSMPRVVIHDLHLLPFDSIIYNLLAILPLLLYAAIAILRVNKRPLYDFIVMGLFYGVMLALIHQILWDSKWGNAAPSLGGNLTGVLDSGTEEAMLRVATISSSVMVGIGLGVIFGLIAVVARKIRARK